MVLLLVGMMVGAFDYGLGLGLANVVLFASLGDDYMKQFQTGVYCCE